MEQSSSSHDRRTGVAPLDVENERDVQAVAEMHRAHFPENLEARCGMRFLTSFYYPTLVRAGLLGCTVAHREGQVVAYISYTRFPRRLFKIIAVRQPLRLAASLVCAGLTRFDALRAIVMQALATMRNPVAAGAPPIPEGRGEVLLLATLPDHQSWIPPGGDTRVTVRLFAAMQEYFRREGVRRVLLIVKHSNTASNLFCHSMGCELDTTASYPGYHHFWHDIPRQKQHSRAPGS